MSVQINNNNDNSEINESYVDNFNVDNLYICNNNNNNNNNTSNLKPSLYILPPSNQTWYSKPHPPSLPSPFAAGTPTPRQRRYRGSITDSFSPSPVKYKHRFSFSGQSTAPPPVTNYPSQLHLQLQEHQQQQQQLYRSSGDYSPLSSPTQTKFNTRSLQNNYNHYNQYESSPPISHSALELSSHPSTRHTSPLFGSPVLDSNDISMQLQSQSQSPWQSSKSLSLVGSSSPESKSESLIPSMSSLSFVNMVQQQFHDHSRNDGDDEDNDDDDIYNDSKLFLTELDDFNEPKNNNQNNNNNPISYSSLSAQPKLHSTLFDMCLYTLEIKHKALSGEYVIQKHQVVIPYDTISFSVMSNDCTIIYTQEWIFHKKQDQIPIRKFIVPLSKEKVDLFLGHSFYKRQPIQFGKKPKQTISMYQTNKLNVYVDKTIQNINESELCTCSYKWFENCGLFVGFVVERLYPDNNNSDKPLSEIVSFLKSTVEHYVSDQYNTNNDHNQRQSHDDRQHLLIELCHHVFYKYFEKFNIKSVAYNIIVVDAIGLLMMVLQNNLNAVEYRGYSKLDISTTSIQQPLVLNPNVYKQDSCIDLTEYDDWDILAASKNYWPFSEEQSGPLSISDRHTNMRLQQPASLIGIHLEIMA
jgi:hypothetical protein